MWSLFATWLQEWDGMGSRSSTESVDLMLSSASKTPFFLRQCHYASLEGALQGKILGGLLAASASKHLGTLAALLGGFLARKWFLNLLDQSGWIMLQSILGWLVILEVYGFVDKTYFIYIQWNLCTRSNGPAWNTLKPRHARVGVSRCKMFFFFPCRKGLAYWKTGWGRVFFWSLSERRDVYNWSQIDGILHRYDNHTE